MRPNKKINVSCRRLLKMFCMFLRLKHALPNRKFAHEKHHTAFGEALRIRVKKFKQTLPENYSESTKIAITACKFSKIFRVARPRTPLELFFFLNQLQICSFEKKLRLQKMWK